MKRSTVKISTINIVALFLAIMLLGCGLPDVLSIPEPVRLNVSGTVLAFAVPENVTDIQGYTVYYKVYFSNTDFLDEEDESKWFDEGYYINSNDEMQPGPVIPNQQGYIRVGEYGDGADFYKPYQITDLGFPSNDLDDLTDLNELTRYYIDFDPLGSGVFNANNPMPIVYGAVLAAPPTGTLNTLVRGVIDVTDTNLSFRSFVNNPLNPGSAVGDWDYDPGGGDNFFDADLRRKRPLTSNLNVPDLTAFMMNGEPFAGLVVPSDLIIGVVVHSYGLDVTTLQPLYSKPVYLGRVVYSPLIDTNRSATRP